MYWRISERHPLGISLKSSVRKLEKANLFLLILGLVLLISSIRNISGPVLLLFLILPAAYILTACIGFVAIFTENPFAINSYTMILKIMITIHILILSISLLALAYGILLPINCDNTDDTTCNMILIVKVICSVVSILCIGLSAVVIITIRVILENIKKFRAEIQLKRTIDFI
ncbi:hypothetical protein SteCoe_38469 [Stentor coeruleus]|uniref:Uncharacterized protein n=1 Tax=Stentor coeruleus TaxID=5963 RepID=A0A1R2ALC7_9CILI|nr:hypothetical protein SteCoe_38469 [Stentor coeruleus]